jgi:lipoprotein-anchoring transpeptidase ErfK/SrfK
MVMSSLLRLFGAGCLLAQLLAISPSIHAAARAAAAPPPARRALSAAAANVAAGNPILDSPTQRGSAVLRAQILLDRAHFSPGEIDGRFGGNTRSAAAAFNLTNKIEGGAVVSAATWQALNRDAAAVMVPYTISAEDLAGPYVAIPQEIADQAKLPALGYENMAEALGEKFHISPAALAALNPGMRLDRAGAVIQVPNVVRPPLEKTAGMSIRVSRSRGTVDAIDARGVVLARYPATTGSTHDPLPLGSWKVNGVAWSPPYHYNPSLFWDAADSAKKATLAPGPNSPVGVVWIDLSKPHYGIHGTPSPSTIGKTSSHGCIRLTNWDATELAKIVTPGMPAILEK